MTCRICLEPDNLISVCGCSGTMKFVHKKCIDKWRIIKKSKDCELCQQPYRIHYATPIVSICIVYICMGLFVACTHAFIINRMTKMYPGDLFNSVLCSFFMFGMYSMVFCILSLFEHIYTKIAYIAWPLGFFSLSITLQYGQAGFNMVELWTTYILFVVYFIGWIVFDSFFK